MASLIRLLNLGKEGVNVDSSNLHMQEGEVRKAQNVVADANRQNFGLANREGLGRFNASAAAGTVLGGICVPLIDELSGPGSAESHLYIGTSDFALPPGEHTLYFPLTGAIGLTGPFVDQGDGYWESSANNTYSVSGQFSTQGRLDSLDGTIVSFGDTATWSIVGTIATITLPVTDGGSPVYSANLDMAAFGLSNDPRFLSTLISGDSIDITGYGFTELFSGMSWNIDIVKSGGSGFVGAYDENSATYDSRYVSVTVSIPA